MGGVGRALLAAYLVLGVAAGKAGAQQSSGIAGAVRDESGAVLPGVTVEAASPALIEKVRAAVTDAEGRYNIIELRPGAYTVTFTLPGFSTVKRDGIELPVGFTATVNADLKVGALEETIVVTGAAPLVDSQSVRQQKVLGTETLSSLPTGNASYATLVSVTAGFAGTQADVGGTRDTWAAQGSYTFFHGKLGTRASFDGMRNQYFVGGGPGVGYIVNPDTVAEFQLESSGMSAEAAGGTTQLNAIPKDGSNTFSLMLNGRLSTEGMQSSNLDDALRNRGLTSAPRVQKIYRAAVTGGGPIIRDKLWFFTAIGRWGMRNRAANAYFNQTQGTLFYTPDLSRPAEDFDWYRTHALRLTWQANSKNKFAFFGDIQKDCRCTTGFTGANAIEAQVGWDNDPAGIVQGTWSAPLTSKLLLDAGISWQTYNWINFTQPGVTRDHISILEQSTNFRYGAPAIIRAPVARTGRGTQRFSMSYVTGSHTFKTGFSVEQGFTDNSIDRTGPEGVNYTFLRGVPVAVDMYATPYLQKDRLKAEVGIYAQDQWVVNKLTLTGGIRYDYLTGHVPALDLPAGPFVPARRIEAMYKVPEWKDWSPRGGASYDLFGNGRTALKASIGRYVELSGSDFTAQMNPIRASINTAARSWRDADGDFVPDCDLHNLSANGECGQIDNSFFGQFNPNATTFDRDIVRDNRAFLWDLLAEAQHEVVPGISLNFAYNRNWDRQTAFATNTTGIRVTDNLDVEPSDHSPYCVTAPLDSRLPGGGGFDVCGLYDLNPSKFGQVRNFVTLDKKFGNPSRVWSGFTVGVNGRVRNALRLSASIDSGRHVRDNCYVVDSPQQLLNCRTVQEFSETLDFRAQATYNLPREFVVGFIYQNRPGVPILADYPATNAQIAPSLGRNLSGGRLAAVVPLMVPFTEYEERFTQLDIRFTKNLRIGRYRVQGNLDLYNALNSNSIQSIITTFGPRWRQPLTILDARLLQLSGQISF